MKLVTIDLEQEISWQEYDPEHEDYNDVSGRLEDFLSFAEGIEAYPVPTDPLLKCEEYLLYLYVQDALTEGQYNKALERIRKIAEPPKEE